MMNNLAQIAQLVQGKDPQAVVMDMLKTQKINDPNINQLITFAQKGDNNSLVNLATTLFKQQGLDFNQEFNNFMSLMK